MSSDLGKELNFNGIWFKMQGTIWAGKILEKKIDGFDGRLRCE